MARAESERLRQVEAWIERCRAAGLPEELEELFKGVVACFDNANRLISLFGVVDEGAVDEAWKLYQQFISYNRPTLH